MPVEISQDRIRNFCIIAHIDHGKSTLADRFLEVTQTVEARSMRAQYLDTMDLERERGITIKLQPVSMRYTHRQPEFSSQKPKLDTGHWTLDTADSEFILNLIDTPGHVDFTYEVSRSLAAVEGAILLVDASQGIQAQTLTTLHQAQAVGLTIIPVVNKIDLPNAEPELVATELVKLLGCSDDDVLFASGKTGEGIENILSTIVNRVPHPKGDPSAPLRALIFDSVYDTYRGVISFVRVVDGSITSQTPIQFMATSRDDQTLEVGVLKPKLEKTAVLSTGMIGYVITNVKDVSQARVGDTVTEKSSIINHQSSIQALPGYREATPMVYAGLYTTDGDVNALRDALGKLKLNDASLQFEPDSSRAFGLGFRAGFLGLLHLEIVTERLSREFSVDLIVTTPSVAYNERQLGGKAIYSEPWVRAEIVVPNLYVGPVMELATTRRGIYQGTEYLASGVSELERLILRYEFPLASIITNFYDTLKSVSSGYASLNYELIGYREDPELVKLSVLVAGDDVEELGQVVHRSEALHRGAAIVKKLKELIPRQNFEVALQAALGGKIVARETISALRKDVTAKLYGGDRTRKDKLLKKQAEGKKRLKKLGRVDIPSDVFIQLLK